MICGNSPGKRDYLLDKGCLCCYCFCFVVNLLNLSSFIQSYSGYSNFQPLPSFIPSLFSWSLFSKKFPLKLSCCAYVCVNACVHVCVCNRIWLGMFTWACTGGYLLSLDCISDISDENNPFNYYFFFATFLLLCSLSLEWNDLNVPCGPEHPIITCC